MAYTLKLKPAVGSEIDFANYHPKLTCSIPKQIIFTPLPNNAGESGGGYSIDVLMFEETFTITATVVASSDSAAETVVTNLRSIAKTDDQKLTLTFGTKTQTVTMKNFEFALDPGKGYEFSVKITLVSVKADPEELVEE